MEIITAIDDLCIMDQKDDWIETHGIKTGLC